MSVASIPVDLLNPGQVFACLGFLEAADVLAGDAEGGFDWTDDGSATFTLSANGDANPFATVLEFLADAELKRWAPVGYTDPKPKKRDKNDTDEPEEDESADDADAKVPSPALDLSTTFVAKQGDRTALPIRLARGKGQAVALGHWADGSSREPFKLYAGNRTADGIARAMLKGTRKKASDKGTANGRRSELKTKGILQLWAETGAALTTSPFNVLTPMGGSFNFDGRGAWTAIDAGYSPNTQKHRIQASPVVEFLAAWGLQDARPQEFGRRQVRYAVWGLPLPPMLARVALGGALTTVPLREFRFELGLSGKNKIATPAQEELKK